MNYFIISGTSKGLGKAIANKLAKAERTKVFGLSRSGSEINSAKYEHHLIDITDYQKVRSTFDHIFEQLSGVNSIFLINNAGIVSPINKIEDLEIEKITYHFKLNLIAAINLSSYFLKKTAYYDCKKGIINISSGAAKRPIHGWSCYNSSKASLDMFTENLKLEKKDYLVDSFDPGVVDTTMQETIRATSADQFHDVHKFIGYHKKGILQNPDDAAKKFVLKYFNSI
jgi:benzil reductase ((S)-benzoin forming)